MSFSFQISNGSLVIDKNGKLKQIRNNEKLIQSCLKILLTEVGSNPHHPGYGSLINQSLVGNVFEMEFLSGMASDQIRNSLNELQKNQKQQSLFQKITPEEQLAAVGQIIIERNRTDLRYFSVVVDIVSGNVTKSSIDFDVRPL